MSGDVVGAAGWDLWAFWSGLPVVFVCAGRGCRRGCSPLLQHQFYGLGPLPPSLGNLALSCMHNFLFSQLDSFHRLLDIDRSFPLRNNTCTCPPFLPATSLPLYLFFLIEKLYNVVRVNCLCSSTPRSSLASGFSPCDVTQITLTRGPMIFCSSIQWIHLFL